MVRAHVKGERHIVAALLLALVTAAAMLPSLSHAQVQNKISYFGTTVLKPGGRAMEAVADCVDDAGTVDGLELHYNRRFFKDAKNDEQTLFAIPKLRFDDAFCQVEDVLGDGCLAYTIRGVLTRSPAAEKKDSSSSEEEEANEEKKCALRCCGGDTTDECLVGLVEEYAGDPDQPIYDSLCSADNLTAAPFPGGEDDPWAAACGGERFQACDGPSFGPPIACPDGTTCQNITGLTGAGGDPLAKCPTPNYYACRWINGTDGGGGGGADDDDGDGTCEDFLDCTAERWPPDENEADGSKCPNFMACDDTCGPTL